MFSFTIVTTAIYESGKAVATKSDGYKSTSLAHGRFHEIDVTSAFKSSQRAKRRRC